MINENKPLSGIKRMRIYDWYSGPYPARVRIALVEKGLQDLFDFVSIDLWKGEHKTIEFREKNFSGTLPVLELENGIHLAECTAITQYLDSLDDDPILTGKTPLEKGIIHMMTKRAELELLDAISVYFHHATPGLGPDVELYQNEEWGIRQRDKALRGMHYFDSVLDKQAFVAGDFFSMADITVIGGLIFAELVGLPIPDNCSALKSWYARMNERPSLKQRLKLSAIPR